MPVKNLMLTPTVFETLRCFRVSLVNLDMIENPTPGFYRNIGQIVPFDLDIVRKLEIQPTDDPSS